MNDNQPEPNDDDVREAVMDVMLDAGDEGVKTFDRLLAKTAIELGKRNGMAVGRHHLSPAGSSRANPSVSERVVEMSWDLARQGVVTFAPEASIPGQAWLRRNPFSECALRRNPPRYHDSEGFLKALRLETTDISGDAAVYLREAVIAFYMDCLLSTCVLLGMAAEGEFLRLLGAAKNSKTYGKYFCRIGDDQSLETKISQFKDAIKPLQTLLPKPATNELDYNLESLQCVIRRGWKPSGQQSGERPPSRDQVYLYLHVFIPFAKQLKRLRQELNETPYPRLVRLH
jgi:hypothetical protein